MMNLAFDELQDSLKIQEFWYSKMSQNDSKTPPPN